MSEDNFVRAKRAPDGGLKQILPDGSTRPLEGKTYLRVIAAIPDAVRKPLNAEPSEPEVMANEDAPAPRRRVG